MIPIKNLSKDELVAFLLAHKKNKSQATEVFTLLWKNAVFSFEEMITIPIETRTLLAEHFNFNNLTIDLIKESADKTIKIAFRLFDNSIIEGVIIPSLERTTACISTQVGCALGCSFCATGTLGLTRNLSHSEIFDQVMLLNRISTDKFGHPLNNIVMMGMGEPLMNYDNVMKSIQCLTSNWGFALSHNRITVSTAGITENIKRLADDEFKCNLAISLHSANEETRTQLMKINKKSNLTELSNAILYFYQKTGKIITFEYLLLQGINDSIEDAEKLVTFCKTFPSKINIITYNETDASPYHSTSAEQRQVFVNYLISHKMIVTLRASKGQDIDAACGQLANKRTHC
jgi:23S rRNA (adenine2503-C2)-methyltransferase